MNVTYCFLIIFKKKVLDFCCFVSYLCNVIIPVSQVCTNVSLWYEILVGMSDLRN